MNRQSRSWLVGACALWVVAMVLVAGLAAVLYPDGHEAMDLQARLAPPLLMGGSAAHPLGTDDLGRDLLARLIYSIRLTIVIAIAATVIGAAIGTIIGLTAAVAGGAVDDGLMVIVDFQASLPYLLMVIAILAAAGNSFPLFIVMLGLHGWERYGRLARGLALSTQELDYVRAARALGLAPIRIATHHVLPNIASALIVNATLAFPQTVLFESSLSFLGLGVQPPATSLGSMVGFGRDYLITAWWIAAVPAAIIFCTSLAFSILGDWLRDRLDPTLARKHRS